MLGALIGAGLSLISGSKQRKEARRAEAVQAAQYQQQRQDLRGQELRNYQRQKEFAKNGIAWKKADALRAGIHPVYALGAPTTSYSGFAGTASGPGAVQADYSDLARAGQDIGRAIDSTRSPGEKLTAYAKTVQDLTLTRMGLENELLSSQVAKVRASTTPGIPSETDNYLIEGQNVPGTVVENPMKRTMAGPGGYRDPGSIIDMGYSQTGYNSWDPVPSDDIKRRIEDSPQEWTHFYRNNIHPWFSKDSMRPPDIPLKDGHYWTFNPIWGYSQQPYSYRRVPRTYNRSGSTIWR